MSMTEQIHITEFKPVSIGGISLFLWSFCSKSFGSGGIHSHIKGTTNSRSQWKLHTLGVGNIHWMVSEDPFGRVNFAGFVLKGLHVQNFPGRTLFFGFYLLPAVIQAREVHWLTGYDAGAGRWSLNSSTAFFWVITACLLCSSSVNENNSTSVKMSCWSLEDGDTKPSQAPSY